MSTVESFAIFMMISLSLLKCKFSSGRDRPHLFISVSVVAIQWMFSERNIVKDSHPWRLNREGSFRMFVIHLPGHTWQVVLKVSF